MAKHTPGPWKWKRSEDGFVVRMADAIRSPHRFASHHLWICESSVDPDDGDGSQFREAMADARLIAAAPDLLEAAERTRAYLAQAGVVPLAGSLNPLHDLAAHLDALIARARGAAPAGGGDP